MHVTQRLPTTCETALHFQAATLPATSSASRLAGTATLYYFFFLLDRIIAEVAALCVIDRLIVHRQLMHAQTAAYRARNNMPSTMFKPKGLYI
jgi:hypothetical protein